MIILYRILGISVGSTLIYGMYRLGFVEVLLDILEVIADILEDIDLD